jgi:two-component system CheB/CheR fusion protein
MGEFAERKLMATVHHLKSGASPKRRVLVVEDNLDSVHSMAMLVKMMGHQVEFAINGFAALDVARKFRPEIVLLDIGLPDFNGCKIVSQLKFEADFQNTRFIAISALPAEKHRQAALDAGCTDFHAKPIDPKVLEELLGDATGTP